MDGIKTGDAPHLPSPSPSTTPRRRSPDLSEPAGNTREPYAKVALQNLVEPYTTSNGSVLFGRQVAETLLQLCKLTHTFPWADEALVRCLDRVRTELLAQPAVSRGVHTTWSKKEHALWGELVRHPVHAALVTGPFETDERELDIIRFVGCAAIARILDGTATPKRRRDGAPSPRIGTHKIGQALRLARPSEDTLPACRAIGVELLRRLREGHPNIDVDPGVQGSITHDMVGIHSLEPSLKALQALLPIVFPDAHVPKGRDVERAEDDEDEPPVQLGDAWDPLGDDSSGVPLNDQVENRTWAVADDESDAASSERARTDDAARRAAVWLRNGCFCGSGRVLTLVETRAAVAYLMTQASSEQPHRADAALCVLLSLATSRSTRQIVAARRSLWGDPSSAGLCIDVNSMGWSDWRRPPGLWSKVKQAEAAGHKFDPATNQLWVALPHCMVELVRKHASTARRKERDRYLVRESYSELEPHIRRLVQELKGVAGPRATLARLRTVLPAFVIERFHDVPVAQVIAGQPLGYSASTLAYQVFDLRRAAELYTEFCLDAFDCGADFPPLSSGHGLFATSDLGRLNPGHISGLVSALVDHTERALPQRWSRDATQQLLQRLNWIEQLARYTYAGVAAGQGHRVLDETANARIQHFHLTLPLASVGDKKVNTLHIWRVNATCAFIRAQVDSYVDALVDFRDWLEKQPSLSGAKPLLKQLRAALTGDGALFLVRDEVHGLHAGSPAQLWPAQFSGLPLNFLRHALVRSLRDLKADPLDIGVQLGHFFGRTPFGDDSLDTAIRFAERLSPLLERHLCQQGWQVLPRHAPTGRRSIPWRPNWNGQAKLDALGKEYQLQFRANRMEVEQRMREEGDAIEERVLRALAARVKGFTDPAAPARGLEVTKDDLPKITRGVLAKAPRDPIYGEVAIRVLRRCLRRFRTKYAWTTPLPPARIELPPELPAVTPFHLRAHADVEQIRRNLFGDHLVPGIVRRPGQPDAACGYTPLDLAVAVLFFDCGVTDTDLLVAAVAAIQAPQTFPGWRHVVALNLLAFDSSSSSATSDSLRSISNWRGGTLPVSGRAAAAILFAAEYIRTQTIEWGGIALPESPGDILRCLQAVLPKSVRIKAGHDALRRYQETVDRASRVERTGPLILSAQGGVAAPLTPIQYRSAFLDEHAPRHKELITWPEEVDVDDATTSTADRTEYRRLQDILHSLQSAQTEAARNRLLFGTPTAPDDIFQRNDDAAAPNHLSRLCHGASSNVATIARFALHTASRRKHTSRPTDDGPIKRRDRLAGSSSYSYVTCFASALLRVLAGRPITALAGTDLEEVFEHVVNSKPPGKQEYVMTQLFDYYRFLKGQGILHVSVSFADIAEELPIFTRFCEPGFVAAHQFRDADQQLCTWSSFAVRKHGQQSALLRRLHVARVALRLMYWCGLRIGEVERLRFCDIAFIQDHVFIWIRNTQHGRVKSLAARRFLHLSALMLDKADVAFFRDWVTRERQLQGVVNERNPIFAKPEARGTPMGAGAFSRLLAVALRVATGNEEARPHWLRHTAVMRWISPVVLCQLPPGLHYAVPADAGYRTTSPYISGVHAYHDSGHSMLATAQANYEHLRPLELVERQLADADGLDPGLLARAFLVRSDLVRQHRYARRRCGASTASREIVAALVRRSGPAVVERSSRRFWPLQQLPGAEPKRKALTAADMASLFGELQRGQTWPAIAHRYGLSEDGGRRLFDALHQAQRDARYWLVPPVRLNELRVACGERSDRVLGSMSVTAADKVQLSPISDLLRGVDRKLARIDWETRRAIRSALRCFAYTEGDSGFQMSTADEERALKKAFSLLATVDKAVRTASPGRHAWCALLCVHCLLVIRHR